MSTVSFNSVGKLKLFSQTHKSYCSCTVYAKETENGQMFVQFCSLNRAEAHVVVRFMCKLEISSCKLKGTLEENFNGI